MSLKPTTNHRYVGIELEFLIKVQDPDKKTKVMINVVRDALTTAGLSNYVHVGYDLSLEPDDDLPTAYYEDDDGYEVESDDYLDHDFDTWFGGTCPVEVRILAKEYEVPFVVPAVVNVIKELGGYINNTCGLHVHLDMRRRCFNTSAFRLFDIQDTIADMMPESRRNNDFCIFRKFDMYFIESKGQGYNRYSAINLAAYTEHKTIEVRCHEGTLDAKSITDWANFLVSVVDNKQPTQEEIDYVNSRMDAYPRPEIVSTVRQADEIPF